MSEKRETEHLDRERLSALLDEPRGHPEASGHLDGCEECRAEFEALSRMRMALSGLARLEPPPDEWTRIEEALERRGLVMPLPARAGDPSVAGPEGARARGGRRAAAIADPSRWPVQAAAAFLLFAGGILAGLQLTANGASEAGRGSGGPAGLAAGRTGDEAPGTIPALRAEGGDAAYLREALAELERLSSPRSAGAAGALDLASAAERLARLDAMIGASREAVRENPADPVANALLFQLVEEREALASHLNQSVHLVALEYR